MRILDVARLEAWLRYLCLLLVVSLSAFSAARLVWSYSPLPELTLAPIKYASTSQTQSQFKLASAELFGYRKQEVKVVQAPTKKTTLKLTLKGVMPALKMQNSMAIISSRSKKDEVYRIGDEIVRGAVLKEVYSDHVIIDRAGKFESLYFNETKLATLIESASTPLKSQDNLPGQTAKSGINTNVDNLTPAEILDTYEALFNEDPVALLETTGLRATGESYVVLASSSLIAMGLKAGDEIIAVNGQSVGNVKNDANLGELVRQQSVANFQIQRGSRTFSVSYPIK